MSLLSTFTGGGGSSLVKYQAQLFTSSGTFTLPAKLVGDTVQVTMIGGGGSGASYPTGNGDSWGGNGGESMQQIPTVIVASQTVTIGAGGAGVSGAGGNAGGSTSFGSKTVAGGGGGASTTYPSHIGGSFGGTRWSSLMIAFATSQGGPFGGSGGTSNLNYNYAGAGGGGLVLDDSGTTGGEQSVYTASGGVGYGAGGAASTSSTSGAGASGAVLVEWMEEV